MIQQTNSLLPFHQLNSTDAATVIPMLRGAGKKGCEYSFATLFMWRRFYHNLMAVEGGVVYVSTDEYKPAYLLPVGGSLPDGVNRLKTHTTRNGHPLRFVGVDEEALDELSRVFPGEFTAKEQPGDADYLYASEDLANLGGAKYHGKRNHISAFSRQYDWSFSPLTEEDIPAVLTMTRQWCAEKGVCGDDSIRAERCGIAQLLENRHSLQVRGGLIRVDGVVVAYTLGSPISDRVFDIQVEKALPQFPGAYAVINREFARTLTDFAYINRENDMNIEGLRKAKLSYYPAEILKKYTCTFEETH